MSSVDIREVLKLQERKMSLRQIANRLGLHHTTVCCWVQRAKELGLDYQTVSKVQDQQLHSLFCKVKGLKEEAFYPVDVEAICDAIDQGRAKILDSYMQYLEQAKTSDLPPLKRTCPYVVVCQAHS
ncbi:helix-turn-helix domain-containing protein [Parasutterella excrementihominis]|uniref:helix-turn-helix domain-containing protein n=1 Tax=Parasutterella excrementihominis TaxID=487175 RepID=UPI003512A078